jgi:hypothetical protein
VALIAVYMAERNTRNLMILAGCLSLIITRAGERRSAYRVLTRKPFAERFEGNREGGGPWVTCEVGVTSVVVLMSVVDDI